MGIIICYGLKDLTEAVLFTRNPFELSGEWLLALGEEERRV